MAADNGLIFHVIAQRLQEALDGVGFLSRNRYLRPSCKGQKVGPSFQGQHF